MSAEEREAAFLSINIEGIMYMNINLEFQVISIINPPADRIQRKDWCVGQVGIRLSRGAELVRFDLHTACGHVVVPMREPYAKELGLVYDNLKIITDTTCTLWSGFDPEKNFPGEGELRMTAFLLGIPFGQGAEVPQSFEEMLDLIETEKPTILNSTPVPGLADALRALQKNEYYSFFGKPNMYGMTKGKFLKEFQNKAKATTFYNDMMVEEKNVMSQSPNGLQHSIQFVDKAQSSNTLCKDCVSLQVRGGIEHCHPSQVGDAQSQI